MQKESERRPKTPKAWKMIGTAIIISIACIDPGNLQGDIDLSRDMHYKSIWVILLAHVLLFFFQEMSLTVGTVSGQDLGNLIRLGYSKKMAIFLWLSSELAIIGADVQEVLGSAIALKILLQINYYWGLAITIVLVLIILSMQEFGQRIFEGFFALFVLMMFICFSVNFVSSDPPIKKLLWGFVPNIPQSISFTGVIGAIIMPQNIFLHSSLVQTREKFDFSKKTKIKIFRIETIVILIISFGINFTICTLFSDPKYKDEDIKLENVGDYLVHFLPSISKYLWALGLLASGLSSTTSGALTGQYLMNGIFDFKVSKLKRILITRAITIIPCALIIAFFDVDKIMFLLNLVQFIQLPFAIVPLLKMYNTPSVMVDYEISKCKFFTLIVFSFFIQIFNIFSICDVVKDFQIGWRVLVYVLTGLHTLFIVYFAWLPVRSFKIPSQSEKYESLYSGKDIEDLKEQTQDGDMSIEEEIKS
jgi:natural resistance-associated macrophage protein